MTTDDIILAGFAAQPNKGKFKVVGKPFTEEKYGVGLKKGDTDSAPTSSRHQQDGRRRLLGRRPSNKNTEGVGLQATARTEPAEAGETCA